MSIISIGKQVRLLHRPGRRDHRPITPPRSARPATSLELDRLDRMHAGIWPATASGDAAALTGAIESGAPRQARAVPPRRRAKGDAAAFEEREEGDYATETTGADAAIIQAGRTIADRVDQTITSPAKAPRSPRRSISCSPGEACSASCRPRHRRAEHSDLTTEARTVPVGEKISDIREKYSATGSGNPRIFTPAAAQTDWRRRSGSPSSVRQKILLVHLFPWRWLAIHALELRLRQPAPLPERRPARRTPKQQKHVFPRCSRCGGCSSATSSSSSARRRISTP